MNAIVIGATQGLGLELVKKLLSEGYKVSAGVLERKTPPALEELSRQYGDKLLAFSADVTNEDEIKEAAGICAQFLGQADFVCNAAGVLLPGDRVHMIHQCDIAELRKTFEVNTIGAVIVAKYFSPLIRKKGKLFTITSEGTAIKSCGTWVPCYALSKTAATKVSGLFNLAVGDVDYYSVHPGRMNTEMGRTTAEIEPQDSAEGIYNLLSGKIPISREAWYINYKGEQMEA